MSSLHHQMSDVVFWREPKDSAARTISQTSATLSTCEVLLDPQAEVSASAGCSCDLCETIIATSKSEWVFGWIRKLRNWEKALQYEKKCHQLTFDLVSEGSIDTERRVRDKLGILQTEMVNILNVNRCFIS
jgi:hypothetical protein